MPRIAIFAALPWECSAVTRHLRRASKTNLEGHTVWSGESERGEIILMKTGIGPERAGRAARTLLTTRRFDACISTGCAGALQPELRPGDLTVATEVLSSTARQSWTTDIALHEEALALAGRIDLPAYAGPIFCSPEVLAAPATKRAVASEYRALAVEMESEPVAECAAGLEVPFLSLKTILDTMETTVDLGENLIDPASGSVRPLAVMKQLVRNPSAITGMMAVQRLKQASERSLIRFYAAWLATSN